MDGTFVIVTGIAGLIVGGLVVLRRWYAPMTVVALALGSAVGSLIAWRIAVALAPPDPLDTRITAPTGKLVEGTLALGAKGALAVWPVVALVLVLLGLLWQLGAGRFDDPDPATGVPDTDGPEPVEADLGRGGSPAEAGPDSTTDASPGPPARPAS